MVQLVDVVPGSSEWLAARRAGVTATDIVTILGLSSHDSIYSLYWRKLGQVPDEPDRDRWALGRYMEPYIVQRWEDAQTSGATHGGLFRSDTRAWQLATPDCLAVNGPGPRSDWLSAPLECKSWADADKKSWETGPPAAVRAQLLWQMDTLDASMGYWAVVFMPSGRFDHGSIEHHIEGHAVPTCPVCNDIDLMRTAGLEFYRRLTLELPPPDPDSSAATLAALKARFTRTEGKWAEVDGSVLAAWSDAKDVLKEWETQVREYEVMLRDQAGEASILAVDGVPVVKRIAYEAPVRAHTRHMDYYLRIKQPGDGDAAQD